MLLSLLVVFPSVYCFPSFLPDDYRRQTAQQNQFKVLHSFDFHLPPLISSVCSRVQQLRPVAPCIKELPATMRRHALAPQSAGRKPLRRYRAPRRRCRANALLQALVLLLLPTIHYATHSRAEELELEDAVSALLKLPPSLEPSKAVEVPVGTSLPPLRSTSVVFSGFEARPSPPASPPPPRSALSFSSSSTSSPPSLTGPSPELSSSPSFWSLNSSLPPSHLPLLLLPTDILTSASTTSGAGAFHSVSAPDSVSSGASLPRSSESVSSSPAPSSPTSSSSSLSSSRSSISSSPSSSLSSSSSSSSSPSSSSSFSDSSLLRPLRGCSSPASCGIVFPRGSSDFIDRSTVELLMRNVFRVHVARASPNFGTPWQLGADSRASGSAFPLDGRRVITNAHVVNYAKEVRLEKPGFSATFPATIVAVAHELDLAVLSVASEFFWEFVEALQLVDDHDEWRKLPQVMDQVFVVGYPTNGDALAISRGSVNRAEVGTYAHSGNRLPQVQIDAPINPGNSGGPVVTASGRVVGVAFQGLRSADSMGYLIPSVLVGHLLEDLLRHGHFSGVPTLGVTTQPLTNPSLRNFLGLQDDLRQELQQGVDLEGCLVTSVDAEACQKAQENMVAIEPAGFLSDKSNAAQQLLAVGFVRGDVILALDGVNVQEDCTIHFRGTERMGLELLLVRRYPESLMNALVLRQKLIKEILVPLTVASHGVPVHTQGVMPRYLIYAGLVFVPLTKRYIVDFRPAKNRYTLAARARVESSNFATKQRREVVVLSRVIRSAQR
eukprot:GHVT01029563.1.p1 GENE.GHVT01029563.1~~GHVT01029563.1.p1  ORF type:complete len:779 (+),score=171.29 GHVT01029563.1:2442-4778(+)